MSQSGSGKDVGNPLGDVQNILGFLLAGFAGVLGFIGLRSAEVSTVLRNELPKAAAVPATPTNVRPTVMQQQSAALRGPARDQSHDASNEISLIWLI